MLKYALLVFLGACSYGGLSTIIKLGMKEGFQVSQLVGSQFFIGWLLLIILTLLFNRKRVYLRSILQLIVGGFALSGTTIFYNLSVAQLPASIAVVLLFQFTWLGVLLEAIVDRKKPSKEKVFSIVVLLAGTVLAGGLLDRGFESLTLAGTVYGLLSAITFALYIFASGRLGLDVPVFTKSLTMVTTAVIVVFSVFSPTFLVDGTLGQGLWMYGLALSSLGIIIPVVFFSVGVPKVGSGLGTILGAAELPAAVIASVTVLGEHVSMLQWSGILLILLGIIVPPLILSKQQTRHAKAAVH
ncbi:DMT family transporter [Brevibacillus laterosporus]|uniref:EamA family transporter n=1 Tax=Brevibacillus laterosporus TaxID=1465 RepID=UPI00036EFE02|nr:DMT family transporter [Brevibacillus laterosporus]ATO48742.1 multidrug transporter [Brevibacillus laterosporus DSM 25]MBG9772181.1 multidrug transporter [Brevibacillus laterosporus]MBG9796864.1 multidrug transporter [Brevibacillus laterosporus]MBG9804436.1 multidrug transporter [Brevibacillus laterosporus]MCR8938918.1 DMT family transporter [Brevibacillus laterosporus]